MMMKQLMEQGRLIMENETVTPRPCLTPAGNRRQSTPGNAKRVIAVLSNGSQSEVTIYDRAVKDGTNQKRISSSSEEANEIDTSDEQIENLEQTKLNEFDQSPKKVQTTQGNFDTINVLGRGSADSRLEGRESQRVPQSLAQLERLGSKEHEREVTAEDRAAQLIKEVELSKARVLDLPGKSILKNNTTDKMSCRTTAFSGCR